MIQKVAKKSTFFSRFKTGVKIVVVIETAAFLGSYYVWHRLNRDQGKIKEKHEFFLHKNIRHLFIEHSCVMVEWKVYVALHVFHFGSFSFLSRI